MLRNRLQRQDFDSDAPRLVTITLSQGPASRRLLRAQAVTNRDKGIGYQGAVCACDIDRFRDSEVTRKKKLDYCSSMFLDFRVSSY